MTLDNPTVDGLDDGVRDLVVRLSAAGFHTTDSGDGYSKAHAIAIGDALPYRHVACTVDPVQLFGEADRLQAFLGVLWAVEGSYHPTERKCVLFAYEQAGAPDAR